MYICAKSLQLYLTLYDPMDCNPPGSSVPGTLQARILEWVAMPSCRDLPNPGTEHASLTSPAVAGRFFATALPLDHYLVVVFCSSHRKLMHDPNFSSSTQDAVRGRDMWGGVLGSQLYAAFGSGSGTRPLGPFLVFPGSSMDPDASPGCLGVSSWEFWCPQGLHQPRGAATSLPN